MDRFDELTGWVKEQILFGAISGEVCAPNSQGHFRGMIPAVDVQVAYGSMGPTTPTEIWTSEDPPGGMGNWGRDDLEIDTDLYLGLYECSLRQIKIFDKGIEHFSRVLNVNACDLRTVVRYHEYGHALVHLGTDIHPGQWNGFLDERSRFWSAIDDGAHEFIAQLIAWSLLDNTCREVFLSLMARQSEKYQLSAEERQPTKTDIAILISTMRKFLLTDPNAVDLGKAPALRRVACGLCAVASAART